MNTRPELFLGLMSGTSLNSIDAALVEFHNDRFEVVGTLEFPLETTLRNELYTLCSPGDDEIHRMGIADRRLGKAFASAAMQLLEESKVKPEQIKAIGSHGQTIRHKAESSSGEPFYSVQIGDPNTIAELTRITTVADFRRRDVAAGGQGAPLAPAFHEYAFRSSTEDRCLVNIGGIANITWLPAHGQVMGFDTGPGNVLMNEWIKLNKAKDFDDNGAWARSGNIIESLLAQFLDDEYFTLAPPKSTGRERYNLSWLKSQLGKEKNGTSHKPQDVMRTLAELTARSIGNHIERFCPGSRQVFITGGGAHNSLLMDCLQKCMGASANVSTTDNIGLSPDWVEAVCFAWLAKQTLDNLSGNIPSVTGAAGPRILGGVYSCGTPKQNSRRHK